MSQSINLFYNKLYNQMSPNSEIHEIISSFNYTLDTLGINPLNNCNNYSYLYNLFLFPITASTISHEVNMSTSFNDKAVCGGQLFDGVIFKSLEDSYPTDGKIVIEIINNIKHCLPDDEICLFNITSEHEPMMIIKCSDGKIDGNKVNITINLTSFAEKLPDDELYHLSYCSNGKSIGISTSFRILRPNLEDFVEYKTQDASDDDEEFIVIKSEKALFQERLNQLASENGLLEFRNRTLTDRIKILENELSNFKSNNTKDQSIIEILKNENEILNRKVDSLKSQNSDLKITLDLSNKTVDKFRNLARVNGEEFEEMNKSKNLLQKEYSECLNTLEKRANEKIELQNKLKYSQELIRELQLKLADEIKINNQLSLKLRSSNGQHQQVLTNPNSSQQDNFTQLNVTIDKLTRENERLTRENTFSQEQKVKAEARLARFQSKVEVS